MSGKEKVAYFYQSDEGHFYYGPGHPMKPHRLQMTHNLVLAYGLYKKMQCFRPHLATDEELVQFHAEDYVDFIRRVTPDNSTDFAKQLQKFTLVGRVFLCFIWCFDIVHGFVLPWGGY